jgi:hypothetical protein
MVMGKKFSLWRFDNELPSHTEMDKPDVVIAQVEIEILTAATKLHNRFPRQLRCKVVRNWPSEPWLTNIDGTNSDTFQERFEAAAHRFDFW